MNQPTKITLLVVAVALIAGGIGYSVARRDMPMQATATAAAPDARPVLYWYDPMYPDRHFDKPGKSPFMDMELRPRYEGDAATSNTVSIDPGQTQNLGVRLVTVQRGMLGQSVDATGVIAFNERDVAIVQARAEGFVERTYNTAPGDIVGAGAPLADLYVASWNAAQTEFLALLRTREADLIEAGRQRLRLLGVPPGLITAIERSGQPQTIATVTTPIAGVIKTLTVRQGMTVSAGMTLAEVNGLSTVWLNASVPESQAGTVQNGMQVTAELAAFPGERFAGRVAAILPEAQQESRTLRVRIELPNQSGKLRPGMFATVHLAQAARSAVLVPAEAVIRTGRRNLVMVARENGGYEPADVETGREAEGQIEILSGLKEGERVVASGQFLIDSEASLVGVKSRGAPGNPTAPATSLLQSKGLIEKLSAESVTLSHEPVPAIGWPAMTMTFRLANPQLAQGRKVGDRVTFGFVQEPNGPVVRSMEPMP